MKNNIIIIILLTFAISYSMQAEAGFWSNKKESNEYMKQEEGKNEKVPDQLINDKQHEIVKIKKSEDINIKRGMSACFEKCDLDKKAIAKCHGQNKEHKVRQQCVPNDKKECLIECAHEYSSKLNTYSHTKCFNKCTINKQALIGCKKQYQDKGLSGKGKCLPAKKKQCLDVCFKDKR